MEDDKEDYTEDQMIALGGKLWEKHGKRRVYFNNWPEMVGMEINRYKSGNISSAFLGEEKISNRRAAHLLNIKMYFEDGLILASDPQGNIRNLDEMLERFVAAVDAKLAETAKD